VLHDPPSHWDYLFLDMATRVARESKDPSTQVGCVLVGPGKEGLGFSFNGLPRGVDDTERRLHNRAIKYRMIVHAEQNMIATAARMGITTLNCSMYMAARNLQCMVWGGYPCDQCAASIVQAGIREFVSWDMKAPDPRWGRNSHYARDIFAEAGVLFRTVSFYPDLTA